MAHHHHHHHHNNTKKGNIKVAFFLNLGFTIIELIGGLLTNSLAILSDALHDLGDSIALGLAWYLQHVSSRKGDKTFSYGYRRFSLIGAVINSVILIVGSIFIVKSAIPRLLNPEEAHAPGMMLLAILGIVVNALAIYQLKDGKSLNEKVVSTHLLEDVLGWIAVLIGAIIIYFTDFYIIDPILSVGIALYILLHVYKNLWSSIKIILQAIPDNVNLQNIQSIIQNIEGVVSIHDLHIWSLDGEKNVLSVHVVLKKDLDHQHAIKLAINKAMEENNIQHCTIETEVEGEECVSAHCD